MPYKTNNIFNLALKVMKKLPVTPSLATCFSFLTKNQKMPTWLELFCLKAKTFFFYLIHIR